MAQPVQIPGLGNATGHQGIPAPVTPPKATQAVRSQILFLRTGGFR
jgi:hypothetical protein